MATTPLGIYYPPYSNAADVPSVMQQAALSIDTKLIGLRPVSSAQVSAPPYAAAGTTNFTSAAWPPLTFTVPASGQCWISLTGNIINVTTTTSTVFMLWAVTSGALTPAINQALSAAGGRQYATKRILCTGTPGASVTLTPQWSLSSYTAGNATISDGLLVMEPIA